MKQDKIRARAPFPVIAVDALEGRRMEDIGKPTGGAESKMYSGLRRLREHDYPIRGTYP